ncbi:MULTISPECIES: lactate utilization protein C [unclassified Ornithinimicrobium]|uniref:LutC/YkgG family protein n=1 Tax=unclassified Ornithinimicrobium TaxID=2615080 RepID=UPI003852BF50
MSAREEILGHLREATQDISTPKGHRGPVPIIQVDSPGTEETLELFAENVADYRATVVRCAPGAVGGAVAEALARAGARTVVVPHGLEAGWVSPAHDAGVELRSDEHLDVYALDAVDAVVTASRVGIATTGTIVLDHAEDQGRRALSLVPDQHVCVIRADQVVHDVPAAVALVDPLRPLTWISGPSATSDIELDRVEGVHGPRTLDVIIVEG